MPIAAFAGGASPSVARRMRTLLSLALVTACAFRAGAATYTVLNTNDSGSNSLRLAISSANSFDHGDEDILKY